MTSYQTIEDGVRRTEAYIERHSYRGYDPYDALLSPIFRIPVVGRSRVLRLGTQQVLRRLPVNIRPLLGVRPGRNPVTLGLVLQGLSHLSLVAPERAGELRERASGLIDELKRLRSTGYSGDCWGSDFPWQTRRGLLPPFSPTIVATCFVTNGLFSAYELLGLSDALELCEGACEFVLQDLVRTPGPDDSFCWAYAPVGDASVVLNATAKGSRLCAQVYSVTGQSELLDAARSSLRFVVQHQQPSGAWPYAIDPPLAWVDNFHTGYVLDSLDEYSVRTDEVEFREATQRGWEYYRATFFDEGFLPRYYDQKRFPIDATACAQALLTLSRFGDIPTALRLAEWSLRELQRSDGAFAYRIYRHFRNRIPYMRWSTAWMFAALCGVLAAAEGTPAEQP
jgi:hypothetical protein